MSINKQHTGAFARSRYGFPNFAESPLFARGSLNHPLSWRVSAGSWIASYYNIGLPGTPTHEVALNIETTAGSFNDDTDSNISEDSVSFWGYPNNEFQIGTIYTSRNIYLPGVYYIHMQNAYGDYATAKQFALPLPDGIGHRIEKFQANLIALDNGQIINIAPADIGVGLDTPLKAGILAASYIPSYLPGDQFGPYYAVDATIDTRILFGRSTPFKPQLICWQNGPPSGGYPDNVFLGGTTLPLN